MMSGFDPGGDGAARAVFATTHRRRTARTSVELIAKIARAVHYAHQHGVLHRDLKPTMMMI